MSCENVPIFLCKLCNEQREVFIIQSFSPQKSSPYFIPKHENSFCVFFHDEFPLQLIKINLIVFQVLLLANICQVCKSINNIGFVIENG